ncbi:MAG: thiamine biosynthesis protein ThiS [Denitrovibrio sp.]|nr:MAG: thiamine biosynthesis protein ThiS [Denitrovibrio sp.]
MIIVNMPDGKQIETKKRRIKDILKELHLNENAVLVARGEDLLTPDISLEKEDEITIISVVSGG